jgi:hypothetical protein
MKTFEDPALFFVAYLVLSVPPLVLPHFGLDTAQTFPSLFGRGIEFNLLLVPYLTFFALSIAVAWLRAMVVERPWLVAFPAGALVLSLLPVALPAVIITIAAQVITLVVGLFPKR